MVINYNYSAQNQKPMGNAASADHAALLKIEQQGAVLPWGSTGRPGAMR
jgi:hypothetical protein